MFAIANDGKPEQMWSGENETLTTTSILAGLFAAKSLCKYIKSFIEPDAPEEFDIFSEPARTQSEPL